VTADLRLVAAGLLRVIVADPAGAPIPGASVMVFAVSKQILTCAPASTDASGTALLSNVPLASKLAIVASSQHTSVWWRSAETWSRATVVTIPKQGQGRTVTATLQVG